METIYYGHVPPARDRRTSEGYPGVVLRATQGDHNNIPYSISLLSNLIIAINRLVTLIIILLKLTIDLGITYFLNALPKEVFNGLIFLNI